MIDKFIINPNCSIETQERENGAKIHVLICSECGIIANSIFKSDLRNRQYRHNEDHLNPYRK